MQNTIKILDEHVCSQMCDMCPLGMWRTPDGSNDIYGVCDYYGHDVRDFILVDSLD